MMFVQKILSFSWKDEIKSLPFLIKQKQLKSLSRFMCCKGQDKGNIYKYDGRSKISKLDLETRSRAKALPFLLK